MKVHLDGGRESNNCRDRHNRKRVLTDESALDLEVPRDRAGRFEPQLVQKGCAAAAGFRRQVDLQVLPRHGMSRGMPLRRVFGVGLRSLPLPAPTPNTQDQCGNVLQPEGGLEKVRNSSFSNNRYFRLTLTTW